MGKISRINKSSILKIILPLIAVGVGIGVWWIWADTPTDPTSNQEITFIISKGESIDSIGDRLKTASLIRSKAAFKLFVVTQGLSKKIQAGEFLLYKSSSTQEITRTLTLGRWDIRVTLVEGLRREEMAQVLEAAFAERQQAFDSQRFIELTEGKEGYLFPDTYFIPLDASEEEVVALLLKTFEAKLTPEIKRALETQGLTLNDGLILASLVEREAKRETDRPAVAGILIKRLRNDWPLQVDATVQYALGYQKQEKSWWKKSFSKEDLELNSPFNTYQRLGLPPAPICNPSLSSINAVAIQETSDYWYYISDNQGNLHYARTLEEHNANIRRFLNK